MTLYENRLAAKPQTHVLLIAVNHYPHLNDGGKKAAPKTYGQGQLTTPIQSALKLADWFKTKLNNPAAQLGSIEMVLSPGGAAAPAVGAATLPNIKKAFSDWYGRCKSGDVAWFYFCGHGLESNATVLLAEDYGSDPNNPWDGAFDFRGTFTNLADWSCKTQIFAVDACRTLITDPLIGIPALRNATPSTFPQRDAPIFRATSFGNTALGPPTAPSYFSEALVDCLNHLGASHFDGNDWVVDTASLARALVERMNRTINNGARKFLPCDISGGSQTLPFTPIHTLPESEVRVMSTIACDPPAADDESTLEAHEPLLPHKVNSRGMLRPWWPELPVGVYDLTGKVVAGSNNFSTISPRKGNRVAPPLFTRNLQAIK